MTRPDAPASDNAAGVRKTRGHLPFAIVNRTLNPVVGAILRSPAHGLLSRNLVLISVTGRRSGRVFTFPVGYRERAGHLAIQVGAPGRKRWWRNLTGGERVTLRLRGARRAGVATATTDAAGRVAVDVALDVNPLPAPPGVVRVDRRHDAGDSSPGRP